MSHAAFIPRMASGTRSETPLPLPGGGIGKKLPSSISVIMAACVVPGPGGVRMHDLRGAAYSLAVVCTFVHGGYSGRDSDSNVAACMLDDRAHVSAGLRSRGGGPFPVSLRLFIDRALYLVSHDKVTIISDAPSQSHSIRRAFGFAVAWFFFDKRASGRGVV